MEKFKKDGNEGTQGTGSLAGREPNGDFSAAQLPSGPLLGYC